MYRPLFSPLLLLLALILLTHPVHSQTSTTAFFMPTVPATSGTATSTATSDAASGNTTTTVQCPARYHNCAVVSRPEACCALDQVCVFDDSNRVACCPFRTHCVGTLDTSSVEGRRGPVISTNRPYLVAGVGAVVAGYWVLRGHRV